MLKTPRGWFIIETLLLIAQPFLGYWVVQLRAEHWNKLVATAKSSGDQLYGDCSGFTNFIIPLALFIFTSLFVIWSFIMIFVANRVQRSTAFANALIILFLSIIPLTLLNIYLIYKGYANL